MFTMIAPWLLGAPPALAHIGLDEPVARYEDQKNPPCGADNDERTTNMSVFAPGQTITVSWRETIDHPSHYRISFDDDGTDDFVDPAEMQEYYSAPSVLLDEIEDTPGGGFSVDVTLPDVECDNCTLQVIQVMYDKPPYTIPGNDIYYQCADLVLRAGAVPIDPIDPMDPMDPFVDNEECGCASAPGGVPSALVLTAALLMRRRSRGEPCFPSTGTSASAPSG